MVKYNRFCCAVAKRFKNFISTKNLRAMRVMLGGALLLAAALVFLVQWNEGVDAGHKAQVLLDESGIKPPSAAKSTPATVGFVPVTMAAQADNTPEETPAEALPTELQGYTVIARLDIAKLKLSLPVLSETTDKALKISACMYRQAEPCAGGNIVITGHNYRSGAIFGHLSNMDIGDDVLLTESDRKTYSYTVYAIDHIKPDEAERLDDNVYNSELSLLTCENNGNGRLLVRCRPKE